MTHGPIIDKDVDASYPWLMQRGILPPKILLGSLACMLGSAAASYAEILPASFPLFQQVFTPSLTTNLLSASMFVGGIAVSGTSRREFSRQQNKIMSASQNKFITSGFFQYSRNPMYLGFVVALCGVVVKFPLLINFAFPLIFFLSIQLDYIPWEERTMEAKFGEAYREYKSKTPRWLFG